MGPPRSQERKHKCMGFHGHDIPCKAVASAMHLIVLIRLLRAAVLAWHFDAIEDTRSKELFGHLLGKGAS